MVDVQVTVDERDAERLADNLLGLFDSSVFIEAVAAVAYARWVELAYTTLTKTRDEYIAGIKPPQITGENTAVLELEGTIPNLIEGGAPPYDFRQTHLKGKSSRVIAFGHEAPGGAAGPSASPLGYAFRQSMGEASAKSLGRRVAKAAKQLAPGARLRAGMAPTLKPTHQADVYAGLQKRGRPAAAGGGSAYLTFRTLSQNSPAGTWMYPGVEARDLSSRVLDDMETLAPAVIDGVLSALLGG
jgi:hypothetical protein